MGKYRVDANYLVPDGDLWSVPIFIEKNISGYDELIKILYAKHEETKDLCPYCGTKLKDGLCPKCKSKDERPKNVKLGKKLAFVGFTVAVVAFIWALLAGFGLILVPDTFMYILFGLFFVGVVSGSIGLDKALYKGSKLIKAKDLKWDNPSQSENAEEEIKIKQPVKIVNKTSPLEIVEEYI